MRRFALVLMFCALALPVSAARAWVWPAEGPVLRPFSFDRGHPYAGGQHRGLDIGAPTGTEVVAPARGVVSFAGTVPTGGKTVSIQTPLGYTATLVHLGSVDVRQGAFVGEGDVVGTVGPSGTVDLVEPYVYFGVRLTADAQGYVDPLGLLPPPCRRVFVSTRGRARCGCRPRGGCHRSSGFCAGSVDSQAAERACGGHGGRDPGDRGDRGGTGRERSLAGRAALAACGTEARDGADAGRPRPPAGCPSTALARIAAGRSAAEATGEGWAWRLGPVATTGHRACGATRRAR